MLKDEEGKGFCSKASLLRVQRDYVTRQSGKNGFGKPLMKDKCIKKLVDSVSNDISNAVYKVVNDEAKHNNPVGTRLLLSNDIKTTYTTVKAPIFKYSKCRTCRIPCSNGDIIKNGRKLKVNVKKISISDCLKFKDFKVINVVDDTSRNKLVPFSLQNVTQNVQNSFCDDLKKCIINGKEDSTKVDVRGDDDESTAGIIYHGESSADTDIKYNNLINGDIEDHKIGVADELINVIDIVCKNGVDSAVLSVNRHESTHAIDLNNVKEMTNGHSFEKPKQNGVKMVPAFELNGSNELHNYTNDVGLNNSFRNTGMRKGACENKGKKIVKLSNGSRNLKRRFNRLCKNKPLDTKQVDLEIDCDLSKDGNDVELKECNVNKNNVNSEFCSNHFKGIANENLFAMVLRSRKCTVNNDTKRFRNPNDIMEEIKILNKGFQSHKKVANTNRIESIFDKENKSIFNGSEECSSQNFELNVNKSNGEKGDLSLDNDNSQCTIRSEPLSHGAFDKNVLPSTSNELATNRRSSLLMTTYNNELKTLSSFNNKNKKRFIKDTLSNSDPCKLNNNLSNQTLNSNEQICKCGINFSDCLKCSVDANHNIVSDYSREHNLRHNRKHVRLKEITEEEKDNTDDNLLENNNFYVFESSRRLEFLHNYLNRSILKPDNDIVQALLENTELDIEIIDEDKIIDDKDTPQKSSTEELRCKCEWADCDMQFYDSTSLLDHLKSSHINETLDRKFLVSCLWRNCKFSKQQCSYKWLSNHIMKHCSVRPFKCVILGCELSFTTQNGLARHVPSHFNEGKVRRTCVTTGAGKDNSKTKSDEGSNQSESSNDNQALGESSKKKTKFERFVECYKTTTCTMSKKDQSWVNAIKTKLQKSSSSSTLNCGFVGNCFRLNHKVIGKRTSKDGSTEILLSPSTKILPYKSFWLDEKSFTKRNSSFVDISVNTLSEDVKQHLYESELSSRH